MRILISNPLCAVSLIYRLGPDDMSGLLPARLLAALVFHPEEATCLFPGHMISPQQGHNLPVPAARSPAYLWLLVLAIFLEAVVFHLSQTISLPALLISE
jgi:hypothetical protein